MALPGLLRCSPSRARCASPNDRLSNNLKFSCRRESWNRYLFSLSRSALIVLNLSAFMDIGATASKRNCALNWRVNDFSLSCISAARDLPNRRSFIPELMSTRSDCSMEALCCSMSRRRNRSFLNATTGSRSREQSNSLFLESVSRRTLRSLRLCPDESACD